MFKKLTALALVLLMVLTVLPVTAMAAIAGTRYVREMKLYRSDVNCNTDISAGIITQDLTHGEAGEFHIESVTWTLDGASVTSGKFQAGKTYYAQVNLKTNIYRDGLELVDKYYMLTGEGKNPTKAYVNNKQVSGNNFDLQYWSGLLHIEAVVTIEVTVPAHQLEYNEAQPATCIAGGTSEYWHCSVCGKNFSDKDAKTEIDDVTTGIDPDNHTNLQKVEAVTATCVKDGNIDYWYCYGCKNYYKDAAATEPTDAEGVKTTAPNNHDWGTTVTYTWGDNNATCTATRVCTRNAEHTETANATVDSSITAPTCTTDGKTTYTATFAGINWATTQTTEVPGDSAIGHNWVKDGTDANKHVCDNEGCNAEHDAVWGTWTDAYNGQHAHECDYDNCSVTGSENHNPEADDNDCTTPIKCSGCGAVTTAGETGHDFTGNFDGHDADNHWHICNNSGCEQTDTHVAHTQFVYHETSDGSGHSGHTKTCKDCGYTDGAIYTHIIIIGHDPQGHWEECDFCEYSTEGQKAPHTYGPWTEDKNDSNKHVRSCTLDGCEHSETHDADWKETGNTATCTTPGVKTFTCQVKGCGLTKTEDSPVLEHSYKIHHNTHHHWQECDNCHKVIGTANHTYGKWVLIERPSFHHSGEKMRECSFCGYRDYETIPAIRDTQTITIKPGTPKPSDKEENPNTGAFVSGAVTGVFAAAGF